VFKIFIPKRPRPKVISYCQRDHNRAAGQLVRVFSVLAFFNKSFQHFTQTIAYNSVSKHWMCAAYAFDDLRSCWVFGHSFCIHLQRPTPFISETLCFRLVHFLLNSAAVKHSAVLLIAANSKARQANSCKTGRRL